MKNNQNNQDDILQEFHSHLKQLNHYQKSDLQASIKSYGVKPFIQLILGQSLCLDSVTHAKWNFFKEVINKYIKSLQTEFLILGKFKNKQNQFLKYIAPISFSQLFHLVITANKNQVISIQLLAQMNLPNLMLLRIQHKIVSLKPFAKTNLKHLDSLQIGNNLQNDHQFSYLTLTKGQKITYLQINRCDAQQLLCRNMNFLFKTQIKSKCMKFDSTYQFRRKDHLWLIHKSLGKVIQNYVIDTPDFNKFLFDLKQLDMYFHQNQQENWHQQPNLVLTRQLS